MQGQVHTLDMKCLGNDSFFFVLKTHCNSLCALSQMDAILTRVLKEPVNFAENSRVFFKAFEGGDTWSLISDKVAGKDKTLCAHDGATRLCQEFTICKSRGRKRANKTWMKMAYVQDAVSQEGCEFFHELAVSMLVCKYLDDIPTFSMAKLLSAEWRGISPLRELASKGNTKEPWAPGPHLYFADADGNELEDSISDLTALELDSVLKQVLVALRIAQHRIHLKHHDMHLGNVLLHKEEDSEWRVETPEGPVVVPIRGYRAVIIDFGLSSAIDPETNRQLRRLDEAMLTAPPSNESDSEGWGVWGPKLEGDNGYDVAMLIESMVEGLFIERPLSVDKIKLVASLQPLVNINFTRRGRPAERCVVDWTMVFKAIELL